MAEEDHSDGGRPSRDTTIATWLFIGAVALLALVLLAVAVATAGLRLDGDLLAFLALALVVVVGVGQVVVEGRVRLSLSSVVLLGGQAIVGPAGVGLLALLIGLLQGRGLPSRARVFNAAQGACYATLGGLVFLAVGGSSDPAELGTVGETLLRLALPLLLADVVQLLTNTLLLAGVVRVSQGGAVRTVIGSLLRSTGLPYLAYGVIAFLLVVLWRPAGIGAASVALVLAPLLVAQWAYRQHAEELHAHDRALEVLVAAVEAKAPHLAGHSLRVAVLSERVAEALGLGPQAVADVRMAGMLHDVGQTTLPTPLVREAEASAPILDRYPRRSVAALAGLDFLRGALDPIADHRVALDRRGDDVGLPARVVGIVDAYDLLTAVGAPDGRRLTSEEALAQLRERPGVDARLADALAVSLERSETGARG